MLLNKQIAKIQDGLNGLGYRRIYGAIHRWKVFSIEYDLVTHKVPIYVFLSKRGMRYSWLLAVKGSFPVKLDFLRVRHEDLSRKVAIARAKRSNPPFVSGVTG